MRKLTIRSGMRMILAALLMIIVSSYYHGVVSDLFSLSIESEMRFYQFGIFCAAAVGGYGVMLSAMGLVLPGNRKDEYIRVMPTFFMIIAIVSLFFYLMAASFDTPSKPRQQRLRPGETITI